MSSVLLSTASLKRATIRFEMNAFVNENLSGMKITQIFNQQKRKETEFLVKNENLRKTRYQVILAFGIYRPLLTVFVLWSYRYDLHRWYEFRDDSGCCGRVLSLCQPFL